MTRMDVSFFIASIMVGFLAQIIDGALGMAYGITSSSFLLSLGVPPSIASASIHISEIFTSGTSGLSHVRSGNVDGPLAKSLLIPGVIGGILGAYVLTSLPAELVKPIVAVYMLVMGCMILRRTFLRVKHAKVKTYLAPLGFVGGLCDAIGGGGWGPIVTSTLVARGQNPRFAVGSVNLTEFFVTVAESGAFLYLLGIPDPHLIVGLIIGGVIAAPIAAHVCKRIPAQALMIAVGIVIILLSIQMLLSSHRSFIAPDLLLMHLT